MSTIGQKLGETRYSKGLTIDDVAHDTHIHANTLISIEEDDFSGFPSVAYAKSFIRKYSEHLGVDLSHAIEELNSGANSRLGDNELMGEMKKTIDKDRRFRLKRTPRAFRRPQKSGGPPLFLNLILILLIAALGIFYFLGYRASSPEEAREEAREEIAKSLLNANPFGEASPAPPLPPEYPGTPAVAKDQEAPEKITTAPDKPVESPDAPIIAAPASPPPITPGVPPQYPVIKPAFSLQFDDALGQSANPVKEDKEKTPEAANGKTLRPRDTPQLNFADESVELPKVDDLPATIPKSGVEPQAVLRPAGTDPSAETKPVPPVRAVTLQAVPVPQN
jgi:cytoskeletal protein RodZ